MNGDRIEKRKYFLPFKFHFPICDTTAWFYREGLRDLDEIRVELKGVSICFEVDAWASRRKRRSPLFFWEALNENQKAE